MALALALASKTHGLGLGLGLEPAGLEPIPDLSYCSKNSRAYR